ncbi:MAG TPA: ferritin-like fold-containing protein [Actinomycetota bacterium]|jgi:hypothetical protein
MNGDAGAGVRTPPGGAANGDGGGPETVAEVIAAVSYGERLGAQRAQESVRLAPDPRAASEQQHIAEREQHNCDLIAARLREIGREDLVDRFRPFFDAFFDGTSPKDWVEAQTFHYIGDALVSDFADVLAPLVDKVSAEIIRRTLGDREAPEQFALEELTRAMEADAEVKERIRGYSRRIVGEAFTQTGRALDASEGLRELLGQDEDRGKRFILTLLERHRQRLDRLGIEPLDDD